MNKSNVRYICFKSNFLKKTNKSSKFCKFSSPQKSLQFPLSPCGNALLWDQINTIWKFFVKVLYFGTDLKHFEKKIKVR